MLWNRYEVSVNRRSDINAQEHKFLTVMPMLLGGFEYNSVYKSPHNTVQDLQGFVISAAKPIN